MIRMDPCENTVCGAYDKEDSLNCNHPLIVEVDNCPCYLTKKPGDGAKLACGDGLSKPLFSERHSIASKCEDWCKDNGIPICGLNIITAAINLNLLEIKKLG
jgi:hypothetical protein